MQIALVMAPAMAIVLFLIFEMPRSWKRVFFKIPIVLSGLVIAFFVGLVTHGVLGPIAGFVTKIAVFPVLLGTRSAFNMSEHVRMSRAARRLQNKMDDKQLTGGR